MLCDCESINMRSLEKMRMTSRGKSCPGLLSCPVSTLSSQVGRAAVVPAQRGASRKWATSNAVRCPCSIAPGPVLGQGPLARVTGQWGAHRAALVAASGLLPALPRCPWPAPGSCSMQNGASRIYPLRQIETTAGLKPRAQTRRGPSSPARLLRELVMHIAGDQHQVAGERPMSCGQNDPLGWIRRQHFLALPLPLQLSDACLPYACLLCHWMNSDPPSSEPEELVLDVCLAVLFFRPSAEDVASLLIYMVPLSTSLHLQS